MSTARDLIKGSLRLIGAIANGETPNESEETDALLTLNDILESWGIQRLLVFRREIEEFTLTPNKGVYTYGPGGDFDSSRPLRIEKANLKDLSAANDLELHIKICDEDEWSQLSTKSLKSTLPTKLFLQNGSGLSNIYFWPIPEIANKVTFYSWKTLVSIDSLTDDLCLPPGYARALKYNLAVELAPEYGKEASFTIQNIAMKSRGELKSLNKKTPLQSHSSLGRSRKFNILTGGE